MNTMKHTMRQAAHTLFMALTALAITSCAGMLENDSDLIMTPDQNSLSSPNDTIYSVIGTISLMQRVADRTNILGEVRGDLVSCTTDASVQLQNLAAYDFDELGDYNRVADYYAIINNCNYFINKVNLEYVKRGQAVFLKEYAVMKTYRAWAYLQLAINYGQVPFFTDFLATEAAGQEVMQQSKKDINFICDYFITDLAPYIETPFPDYGNIAGTPCSEFFIPVRAMLGELCLWAGRYQQAAQYYHDFFNARGEERPMYDNAISWSVQTIGDLTRLRDGRSILSTSEAFSAIPMEETQSDGTISRLEDLYSSTDNNRGFFQLTRSAALTELSASQNYCYVYVNTELNERDTIIVHKGDTTFNDKKMAGDLRLYSDLSETYTISSSTTDYNHYYQKCYKMSNAGMPIMRLTQLYLHYAEALNRAGFPSAAMLILKRGVCTEYIEQYVTAHERQKAGTLLDFNATYFTRERASGIHSNGCGEADADTTYVLPMPAAAMASAEDTIQYQIPLVEDMIMDEAALECSFEGSRFGDLQRIALRRSDPAYLADRVAMRTGELNTTLQDKLKTPANWYLPLK